MDRLEEQYISIDHWNPLFPEKTTFLLTHLHSDHVRKVPRRFRHTIYTSHLVEKLWTEQRPSCIQTVLAPGQWYKTLTNEVPFRVLSLQDHTIESIGFLFPTLSLLYVGDSLHLPFTNLNPRSSLHVLYDGLFDHVRFQTPTPHESCKMIYKLLHTTCPYLRLVHHGILSFLKSCHVRFALHNTIPPLIENIVRYLDMYDVNSPFVLVGRSFKGTCIVPSSNWFLLHPDRDVHSVIPDGKYHRVFCTLHATNVHVEEWTRQLPYSCFEPISSNTQLLTNNNTTRL